MAKPSRSRPAAPPERRRPRSTPTLPDLARRRYGCSPSDRLAGCWGAALSASFRPAR